MPDDALYKVDGTNVSGMELDQVICVPWLVHVWLIDKYEISGMYTGRTDIWNITHSYAAILSGDK